MWQKPYHRQTQVMTMAKKSGLEIAGNLAHFAKALYDIIRAFMQGGWAAAALQLLKHYWPQILVIALVLILLPIIIFCCLPMMLFGFASSTDTEISSMTAQATTVSAYYDNYDTYLTEWTEWIKDKVMEEDDGEPNTETDDTTHETDNDNKVEYEVVFSSSKIQKNWFIALHAVTVDNNLSAATESDVKNFAFKCLSYTVVPAEDNTENEDNTTTDSDEESKPSMILTIHYRTPSEIMAECGYNEADENWARLMHKTLEMENNSSVGVFGALFSDAGWRECITSEYGYRTDPAPGFHYGLDIGMPIGTEICAVKDGTVIAAIKSDSGYGYHIILDHGEGVETLYAHCSELLVSEGAKVAKGDVIAKVGSTGNSTGPHCHFEVRINGEQVDPSPYLP